MLSGKHKDVRDRKLVGNAASYITTVMIYIEP